MFEAVQIGRQKGQRRSIGKRLRFAILSRDGFRCRYCGTSAETSALHIDHVVPVSRGGKNDASNLVAACADCNLGKAASILPTPIAPTSEKQWPNDIAGPVYFSNASWAVTGYGLESLIAYYPIQAACLGEARGDYSNWLLHLAEKEPFAERYGELVEAFRVALRCHKVRLGFDLAESVQEGKRIARGTLV